MNKIFKEKRVKIFYFKISNIANKYRTTEREKLRDVTRMIVFL